MPQTTHRHRFTLRSASRHGEHHLSKRVGWLRAAVLGANDGIVSTASLVVGVAASNASPATILLTGIAGLVAGAMSMAAGEYVSVHSQADTEEADLALERAEIDAHPTAELRELTAIYVKRGVEPDLAGLVAEQLMARDALGAHARDELGISNLFSARPLQAAFASAASFAVGAALPLVVTAFSAGHGQIAWVSATAVVSLSVLGAIAAQVGGANVALGASRVGFWGALAIAVTAGVGTLFGTAT
jgi:VIT1/CCC1 family predicted Fe2+/Mn2+ transporter